MLELIQPEKQYDTVEMTVPASGLAVSDVLSSGAVVASLKRGDLNMSAFDADGKRILYCRFDQEVAVTRQSLTEESAAEWEAFARNRYLLTLAEGAAEWLEKAVETLNDAIRKSGQADHWKLTELATAQFENGIYARIVKLAEGDPTKLAKIATWLADKLIEKQIEYRRGDSRSTSQMSNLMDDIQAEVEMRFARQWTSIESLRDGWL